MDKDKRYTIIKKLINSGNLDTFSEILNILPKTVVARDLGMHHHTFEKLLKNHDRFMLKHINKIAKQIEVETLEIVKLIINESIKENNLKLKNRKSG